MLQVRWLLAGKGMGDASSLADRRLNPEALQLCENRHIKISPEILALHMAPTCA